MYLVTKMNVNASIFAGKASALVSAFGMMSAVFILFLIRFYYVTYLSGLEHKIRCVSFAVPPLLVAKSHRSSYIRTLHMRSALSLP